MVSSDSVLWQRWQRQRDPDALAEIVSRHSGMVYAACKRILGNAADAEDAAQDCFLELLSGRITVQTSLAPWLYTVAVRRALNRVKAERRRYQRERQCAAPRDHSAPVVLDDLLEVIDAAIADLPEKLRTPVICRFLEGQSYEEIAQGTGVAESTIRYRTNKGIERIRAFLKRRGIQISTAALAAMLVENMAEAAPPALAAMLGKLAVAGTTASIVAGVTLKTVGGLLMMKKLVAGALVFAAILAGVWSAKQMADKDTRRATRARDVPSQVKSPMPEVGAARNTQEEPPKIPPHPEAASTETPEIAAPSAEGIRVAGTVVDHDGQPAAGAHVVARISEFTAEETESSSDGTFEIHADMISNVLTLQAEKESYESQVLGPSKLREPGLDGLVLSLTIPRDASIAGVVVDRTGSPVPSLFVNAHGTTGIFTRRTEPVLTDANGTFKLGGLAPDRYGLVASFNRRNPEILMQVELGAGQAVSGLRAVFDVGDLTIAGKVVDTTGAPIEGADVYIHNGFGGGTSDDKGRFAIEGLAEGGFMVDAIHDAYSWAHVPDVAAGTSDLKIAMLGKATVEGQVVRADTGENIKEFDVFHTRQAEAEGPFGNRRHVYDPEGRFALADLDAGKETVTVRAAGFAPASQDLDLKEHQTIGGLEFRLEAGKRLAGRVETVHGAPIAGAYIYSGPRAAWPKADAYVARTDSAGRFEVTNLSPATQKISAYHPDYAPAVADVGSASELRIVMQEPGSIEGTVLRGGEPVPGMAVMAMYQGGQDTPSVTRTNGNGAYTLEGLAPGTSLVIANAQRLRDGGALQKTAIIEPGRVTRVDFEFQSKRSRIEGRITIDGKPPESAKVGLVNPATAGGHVSETLAAPDGLYAIDDVPTGEVILFVEAVAPGGITLRRGQTVEVAKETVVQQDVAFAAVDKGVIAGQVIGTGEGANTQVFIFEQSTPLPDLSDVLAVLQHAIYAYSIADCGADGAYHIGGLAPGTYVAIAIEVPQQAGDLANVHIATAENIIVGDEAALIQFDLRK